MAHQEAAFLRPILAFDTTKQYNGTFTATMNSNGTFSYTLPSTPTSNAAGSDMQVTFSTGNSLDNAISRLSGMEDQYDGTVLAGYQYLGLSQVVQEDRPQPGIDLTYIKQDALGSTSGGDRYTGLDEFGRVVDQNWTPLDSSRFQSTQDRLQYSYDADGNVLSKTDLVNSGNSQTYTYDNLNRLTGYSQGGGGQSYSMDALGNILTYNGQTRTFNGQNEIASGVTDYSGNKIQYDPAGEVTTYIPSASSPDTWMTYDAWGRVVRIGGASSSNVWEWLYYDANGNRTSINNVTGGISYNTTYSPSGQPLEDDTTQGSTSGAVTYVWGQLYVNDLISEDQTSQPTHNHFYADQDANFDVTSILWYSGSKRADFTYDPYGTLLSATAASQNDENILWQGGQYDYVTSTYRFGARIYIPQLGVWNRQDPAAVGNNAYDAFGDNPVVKTDPLGLFSIHLRGPSEILSDVTTWFGSDAQGRQLLDWWLYGNGYERDIDADDDPIWRGYLQSNYDFRIQAQTAVRAAIGAWWNLPDGAVIHIDRRFHGVLPNGEAITGYNYLHGSNATVGDVGMYGYARVVKHCANAPALVLSVRYTWNDVIEAKFHFGTDALKWTAGKLISVGHAENYILRIGFSQRATIRRDYSLHTQLADGWPFQPYVAGGAAPRNQFWWFLPLSSQLDY